MFCRGEPYAAAALASRAPRIRGRLRLCRRRRVEYSLFVNSGSGEIACQGVPEPAVLLMVRRSMGCHLRTSRMAIHVSRSGAPASIQSRISERDHRTECEIRSGRGSFPAASIDRSVRRPILNRAASSRPPTKRGVRADSACGSASAGRKRRSRPSVCTLHPLRFGGGGEVGCGYEGESQAFGQVQKDSKPFGECQCVFQFLPDDFRRRYEVERIVRSMSQDASCLGTEASCGFRVKRFSLERRSN